MIFQKTFLIAAAYKRLFAIQMAVLNWFPRNQGCTTFDEGHTVI